MRLVATLIQHRWKAFFRSPTWQREFGIYILLGFLMLYFTVLFLFVGIYIEQFLGEVFPETNLIATFHRVLFYYLVADLIARFVMQGNPVLHAGPYLHLPIKKTSLIHVILAQVPFTWFNFFPCLIAVPFAVQLLIPAYGAVAAVAWFFALLTILVGNAYLIFLVRKKMSVRPYWIGLLLGLLIMMVIADYYNLLPVSHLFAAAFDYLLAAPYQLLIPLAWCVGLYYFAYQSLQGLYEEDTSSSGSRTVSATGSFSFLQRYGVEGALMTNELKLILRHKRTRAVLITSLVIFPVAISIYSDELEQILSPLKIFIGVYMTGAIILNYGQFLIAWEGQHIDALLANRISLLSYLNSKYKLLIIFGIIGFLLTLPFIYYGWKILVLNFVCLLFNIGVTTWITIYFAFYNRKALELNESIWLNHQGISGAQILLSLIIAAFPCAIYAIPYYLGYPWLGVTVLAVVGSLGWMMRRFWLQRMTLRFQKVKYAMAEGFRNTEL